MALAFPTGAVFQDQPHHRLGHNHLVQSRDMRMDKLSVMVDFAGQVRVVFLGGFKDDLRFVNHRPARLKAWEWAHLGAIGELVVSEIDLSKGALPYQPS